MASWRPIDHHAGRCTVSPPSCRATLSDGTQQFGYQGACLLPMQGCQGATPDATPGTPVGTPQATPLATSAAPVAISAFLAFEPKGVTIPAMIDIVVTLPNNGLLQHNWDVLGTALMTAIVGSDAVETVTVNLPAGSYDFQCDVPGHAEAGMVGTLTVQ